MSALLAEIAKGERDAADIFFLIAVIVFAIAAIWHFVLRAFDTALIATGLTAVALGWLLL